MGSHESQWAAFKKVVATSEPPRLGPQGRAGTLSAAELDRALMEVFAREKISARLHPQLRSAALLWHDHLDESHTLSQAIETPDGSWLHGIMHRREPDYGNAQYWFRRVGEHMAFPALAERVAAGFTGPNASLAKRLVTHGRWDPFGFVDECERVETGNGAGTEQALRDIQAIEFDVLVEHILRS